MAEGREHRDGTKNDKEKNRLDLMPPDALWELGTVYTIGARKYEDRNWEKGIKYMRVLGALKRHIGLWEMGETFDPEDGQRHLAAAAWNAITLLAYELRGMSAFDDRPREAFIAKYRSGGSADAGTG